MEPESNQQIFSYTDSAGDEHSFRVQDIIDAVQGRTPTQFPVAQLRPKEGLDPSRVARADLGHPIIVDRGFNASSDVITRGIIDGMHRAARAQQLGNETLPVHFVDVDTFPEIEKRAMLPSNDAELEAIRAILAELRQKAEDSPWEFFAIMGNPEREGIGAEVSRAPRHGEGIISQHAKMHRDWSGEQGYQDVDWSEKSAWYLGYREKTAARRMDKWMREAAEKLLDVPEAERMAAAKQLMGRWRRPKNLLPAYRYIDPDTREILNVQKVRDGLDFRTEIQAALAGGRDPSTVRDMINATPDRYFTAPRRPGGMNVVPRRRGWEQYLRREARIPEPEIAAVEPPPFVPLELPS
jgi:hypothetical protein